MSFLRILLEPGDANMDKVTENWDLILQTAKNEYDIGDMPFKTWLKPLTVHKVEGNVVTIVIPKELTAMGLTYISSHFTLPLQVTISVIAGINDCIVKFITEDEIPKQEVIKFEETQPDPRYEEAHLDPRYTFDTFIVGSNNKLAQAAAVAVAESPGDAFNPLFIYGGAGLGKTHLMHSIGHYILEHNKDSKVLYVPSEDFTNELIESIRNKNNSEMSRFREKYRSIDVLLIDDIQFIIGKDSTQEEFFHTFNSLYGAKKQIIISSDKPPKEMATLEERFKSRFEWGLIVDITLPDYETRMAILHKKEETDGCYVSNDVIEYIANNIKSNIRELEGAFNRIVAFAKLQKMEITLDLAKQALQDIVSPDEKKVLTPDDIISTVCQYYKVTPDDLIGTKRNAKIAAPRQIAMYLCRELISVPLKNIGQILGKRDHTTVMYGCEKIEKELQTNETLRSDIELLKKRLTPQG